MRTKGIVAVLAVLLIAGVASADDVKKELEKLAGTWKPIKAEADGNDVPVENLKELVVVIKGDVMTPKGNPDIEKAQTKIKLKIDPSTTPKSIDLTVEDGDEKGKEMEGIYEVKEDELRICLKAMGKERPSEFATKAGSNMVMMTLKREK